MRSLPFIPLAFVAGADGFALFAPYLAVFAAAVHLARWHRRRAASARPRVTDATEVPTAAPSFVPA